jgi:hypothetical protein
MRTTLTIDDDVLQAAKERAQRDGTSAGAVISALARRALTTPLPAPRASKAAKGVLGFVPFPSRGKVVTNEHINKLRLETGEG